MAIYFGFSDEYGDYQPQRNVGFVKAHPFYVRSLVLIDALEWKLLSKKVEALKREFALPEKELKWSYLWSLRSYSLTKKKYNGKEDFFVFSKFDYDKLIDFVEATLGLLNSLKYSRIVLSVTNNNSDWINSKIMVL